MAGLNHPIIRRADEADLPAILQIEQASFESPWSLDYFKHELFNPITHFYVIENDHMVLGYIVSWLIVDELHIANVAIHPQFRKAGLGSKLLNYVLEMGQKQRVKSVTLEVNEKNLPAINLYARFNFKPIGRRLKYYENRDDALIMSREM
jgi:ribosomal-protein-alanine N-acetyltransferase